MVTPDRGNIQLVDLKEIPQIDRAAVSGNDVQPVQRPRLAQWPVGQAVRVQRRPAENEVYLQSFPQPGNKVRVSTGGGITPIWSRDGSRLLLPQSDPPDGRAKRDLCARPVRSPPRSRCQLIPTLARSATRQHVVRRHPRGRFRVHSAGVSGAWHQAARDRRAQLGPGPALAADSGVQGRAPHPGGRANNGSTRLRGP